MKTIYNAHCTVKIYGDINNFRKKTKCEDNMFVVLFWRPYGTTTFIYSKAAHPNVKQVILVHITIVYSKYTKKMYILK